MNGIKVGGVEFGNSFDFPSPEGMDSGDGNLLTWNPSTDLKQTTDRIWPHGRTPPGIKPLGQLSECLILIRRKILIQEGSILYRFQQLCRIQNMGWIRNKAGYKLICKDIGRLKKDFQRILSCFHTADQ